MFFIKLMLFSFVSFICFVNFAGASAAEASLPYYSFYCRFKQEFPDFSGRAECIAQGEFDSRKAREASLDLECLNDVVVVYGVSDASAKVLRNQHGLVLQGREGARQATIRVRDFIFGAGEFEATLAIRGLKPATGFCQFAEIVEEGGSGGARVLGVLGLLVYEVRCSDLVQRS